MSNPAFRHEHIVYYYCSHLFTVHIASQIQRYRVIIRRPRSECPPCTRAAVCDDHHVIVPNAQVRKCWVLSVEDRSVNSSLTS